MSHSWPIRVYYEDTDFGGVVYYANYLRFIERGRTEALRDAGVDQTALKAAGVVFVVRRLTIDYHRPARFDDELTVSTTVTTLRGASVDLAQTVTREGETLVSASVTIACMDDAGAPVRLPKAIRAALEGLRASV